MTPYKPQEVARNAARARWAEGEEEETALGQVVLALMMTAVYSHSKK
jgi:hypothetical protein